MRGAGLLVGGWRSGVALDNSAVFVTAGLQYNIIVVSDVGLVDFLRSLRFCVVGWWGGVRYGNVLVGFNFNLEIQKERIIPCGKSFTDLPVCNIRNQPFQQL